MGRVEKVREMATTAQMRKIGESYYFTIHGNRDHEVIFNSGGKWLCDCEWSSIKGGECSHISAARMALKKVLDERTGKK